MRERRQLINIVNISSIVAPWRYSIFLSGCLLLLSSSSYAQRRPTIIEPKPRIITAPVRPVKAAPPTKGTLIVLFDPEVPGKIVIENLAGKIIEEGAADETGQAQFFLKRGQAYRVKGDAPGFFGNIRQSKILKSTDTVLLKLTARSATLTLVDLPDGARVFIDSAEEPQAVIDKSGSTTISDLAPGKHKLTVKHAEYSDYQGELPELKAGMTIIYPVTLYKIAKLTVHGLAGARVLIDGEFKGTIQDDGKVGIDYQLDQISEHTITVELLGYQSWSRRETLTPGSRTIDVKLDPITTSAGVSDFFDNLSQWHAPDSWKIIADERNKKLDVRGPKLGTLKNKIYKDFTANFTIWLNDGKGATWALRADKEGRSYYLFHLAGPKSTTHTPRRFYTYLVRDGSEPIEVSTPAPVIVDLSKPGSYTITIEVRGYQITHRIVSNELGEDSDLGIWTDTTETKDKFLYGTFGFRSFSGEVFSVDDLSLSPELR